MIKAIKNKDNICKMHWMTADLIVRRAVQATPEAQNVALAIILAGAEILDDKGYAHVRLGQDQ